MFDVHPSHYTYVHKYKTTARGDNRVTSIETDESRVDWWLERIFRHCRCPMFAYLVCRRARLIRVNFSMQCTIDKNFMDYGFDGFLFYHRKILQ